jgi:hypothetical protein
VKKEKTTREPPFKESSLVYVTSAALAVVLED